jgi:hypothetical protein
VLFFFGDGVSGTSIDRLSVICLRVSARLTWGIDLSAAAHADVLFAKTKPDGESDLAEYCKEQGIGYVAFTDFDEALPIVQAVVRGELGVEEVVKRD